MDNLDSLTAQAIRVVGFDFQVGQVVGVGHMPADLVGFYIVRMECGLNLSIMSERADNRRSLGVMQAQGICRHRLAIALTG
jgi:hypothetical protein